jgi:hypothetical protein
MESLNKNNYEIWFLDYLDGQLSDKQLETLLDFLEQNPELKAELIGVSGITLPAGAEILDQKESLMKSPSDIPGISTIDQLCIARMENDLTAEEANLFDARLAEDSSLSDRFSAFQLTRLNTNESITYPNKQELKKKVVLFSPWLITAISSAAVILLVWFLWPNNPESNTPALAKIEIPQTSVSPDTRNLKPDTQTSNPKSQNPTPNTRHLKPDTQHLKPDTRNLKPITPEKGLDVMKEVRSREDVQMNKLTRRSILSGPRIPDPNSIRILYASNNPAAKYNITTTDDALSLPQYALQLFRERILGQDRKLVKETNFSLWEIAGAGVDGINTLAGTNMKLNREYDSKGDILAVSFNSRLIDVESPVKPLDGR